MFDGKFLDFSKLVKMTGNMQSIMKEIEHELESTSVTGEAGAGSVTVKLGLKGLTEINISESLFEELIQVALSSEPNEVKEAAIKEKIKEMSGVLEELSIGAINSALESLEKVKREKMMEKGPGSLFKHDEEEK